MNQIGGEVGRHYSLTLMKNQPLNQKMVDQGRRKAGEHADHRPRAVGVLMEIPNMRAGRMDEIEPNGRTDNQEYSQ